MDSDDDDEPPILIDLAPPAPSPAIPPISINPSDLPPCPVTILSGFLGSGKTTLIQYILKSPDHGKRIAVIENEFGDGLDVESLIARDGMDDKSNSLQDLIELPNGCICCTVKDSLVSTLENLLTKRQDLDYILIEASGMANPGPIASVFWLDDALESRLKLDGIVTLVDAHHILEQLSVTEEASQQIAYADRLLVNKMDLLKTEDALKKVQETLRQLHPTAPMQTTTYSKIPDLDWILNANCFGGVERVEELDTIWNIAATTSQSHHHGHSHDHDHDQSCEKCTAVEVSHRHTAAVATLGFQQAGSVDLSKLNAWLAEILWPNQDEKDNVLTAMLHNTDSTEQNKTKTKLSMDEAQTIFRIKGIASVQRSLSDGDGDDDMKYIDSATGLDRRRYIVQAVHDLWEVHPASNDLQWKNDDSGSEERISKVVVIGKFLNEEVLRQGFLKCFT